MIDIENIDLSIGNIWQTWGKYQKGKKKSLELLIFQNKLEANLLELSKRLAFGSYKHGAYRTFQVTDNKRRIISVSSVQDRIVHRLLYDYLVKVYDHAFDFDVWSCRQGKGLVAGINRCQNLAKKYTNLYFWRADIEKFFASVDKEILYKIIKNKVKSVQVLKLIKEVITSFTPGISIGNLTSQIFGNIYLNEFDRYIRVNLKPGAYLRYGDDFVIFDSQNRLREIRKMLEKFLNINLSLKINPKNNFMGKISHGIKYLGSRIYSDRIILTKRNQIRIFRRLNSTNQSSYYGLLKQFGSAELRKKLSWVLLEHT